MGTPAQIVVDQANQDQEYRRKRQEDLEDDKRKATLKALQEDATTPQDKVASIDAVYHQDPSVLRQHVENLTRRITGKPTQPVVNPQQAQASRVAALGPRAQMPEQQRLAAYEAQLAAGNKANLDYDQQQTQQKNKAVEDLITKYAPPEQRAALLEDFARKQAGVAATLKNIPGTAGQPYKTPGGQWVRPVQQADGSIVEQPMPASWTPPAPKPVNPGTPRVGVSGGRNVYGLLTPKGWVDAGTGQPLADFRPAPTYAQVAPSMRAVQVVDPNDPSSTIYESLPEAIKTRAKGTQSVDYKMQMPTATERSRADLATSAREQLGTMEGILQGRGDLFGPAAGQYTNFTQWIGSQDPDAQRFAAAARIAADHLAGVFGGRSQAALQAIYDVIGKNTTNPAAAIAGLEQMNIAAATIQSRGKGPAPRKAVGTARKVGERKTFPNGKTGVWDGQGWVAQ